MAASEIVKFVTGRSKFEQKILRHRLQPIYERSCDKPYLGTHFQMLRRPRKKISKCLRICSS